MNSQNKLYVGQKIAYIERSGSWFDEPYTRLHWFDEIASIDGNKVITKNGIKLGINENDILSINPLRFKGKMPKHEMINFMRGYEIPTNLGAFYDNRHIRDLYIKVFTTEKECETYKKEVLKKYWSVLNEYKKRNEQLETQQRNKDEALKPLYQLQKENKVIIDRLRDEEHEALQKIIKEKQQIQ